jgi:hypothetical protein
MNRKNLIFAVLFPLGLLSLATAQQPVSITGKITDENGRNVYGATVRLKALRLSTKTDTGGNFAFSIAAASAPLPSSSYAMPYFSGNVLTFTVAKSNEPVTIETFDCRGRCVCAVREKAMAAGTYKTTPFPAGYSAQMYLCRVTIGNTVSRLIKSPLAAGFAKGGSTVQKAVLAKKAASVDTLLISRSGYTYTKHPIDSYTGNFPVTLQVAVSVSFDLEVYQGIESPLIITAKDPYATAATVDAVVSSVFYPTLDTVKLVKDTTDPGAYNGQVYVAVRSSKPLKDTIRVKDKDSISVSYQAAPPLTTHSTANAVWQVIPPSVRPSVSIYLGVVDPININADDRNITDSTITIHLSSHKDTVGINVTLHLLPSSPGSYTGSVGASLTQSVEGKVMAVRPPIDTLTTVYQSPATSTPVVSSAQEGTALLWMAAKASILPDSLGTGYHGTTSVMKISLFNDHIVSGTATVTVKSRKDPTGIPVVLTQRTDTTWIFTGTAGFTLGASNAANRLISVQSPDSITFSYRDSIMVPAETLSISTTWQQ